MPNGEGGPPQTTHDTGGDLMDGFGDGDAEFQDVIDNLKRVFETVQGPILIAWLAIMFVPLVFEGISAVIHVVSYAAAASTGGIGGVLAILAWPVEILAGFAYLAAFVFQFALYGPLRRALFGKQTATSWTGVLGEAFSRVVPVGLGVLAIMAAGFFTCGLGLLLAWLVWLAPYILAIREDVEFGDAFAEAFEHGKAYWNILLGTFGAVAALFLVLGCFWTIAGWVASLLGTLVGGVVSELMAWLMVVAVMFVGFVGYGSAFLVVDEHEGL